MQTIEYRTVDKSTWGDGEWQNEPDKAQFTDEATGLPCLIVRGPGGSLCGYVGVTKGHIAYGKSYDDEVVYSLDVHGGITFGDVCQPSDDESRHVCHKPDTGEPDDVWWLGFDCAHSGDFLPRHSADAKQHGLDVELFSMHAWESYKTIGYVRHHIKSLAEQLAELSIGERHKGNHDE